MKYIYLLTYKWRLWYSEYGETMFKLSWKEENGVMWTVVTMKGSTYKFRGTLTTEMALAEAAALNEYIYVNVLAEY